MDIPNYDNFHDLKNFLNYLKKFSDAKAINSSWAEQVYDKTKMKEVIEKGEVNMSRIDAVVRKYYLNRQADMTSCRTVIG
jgi:hypothetical protein